MFKLGFEPPNDDCQLLEKILLMMPSDHFAQKFSSSTCFRVTGGGNASAKDAVLTLRNQLVEEACALKEHGVQQQIRFPDPKAHKVMYPSISRDELQERRDELRSSSEAFRSKRKSNI